jgi:hypothetical protein
MSYDRCDDPLRRRYGWHRHRGGPVVALMFWPLESGRIVTSRFGEKRPGGPHTGVDFGFPGGSGGRNVYSISDGVVRYAGAAQGYGGPDPCGWLVIESPSGAAWEYGHIRRMPEITVGTRVSAGQHIAVVNPLMSTNGGTAPHLHLSCMPKGYNPAAKIDPLPLLAGAQEPGGTTMPERPDFNEYPLWSPNNQDRNGTKPDLWLIHTQEGNGNADSLARYLGNRANQVSYHYTVSQAADGGVTVCDVVDTDRASWSVLSANNRSINLCFAGSRASWTRAEWIANAGKAIDAAAWLAVKDCAKYGIPLTVIRPPYFDATSKRAPAAGISDHQYVTRVLGDGTHTDVGKGFPWDRFAQRVAEYSGTAPVSPPTVSDSERLRLIWEQLVGPDGKGWPQLGGLSLVDAVAKLLK